MVLSSCYLWLHLFANISSSTNLVAISKDYENLNVANYFILDFFLPYYYHVLLILYSHLTRKYSHMT